MRADLASFPESFSPASHPTPPPSSSEECKFIQPFIQAFVHTPRSPPVSHRLPAGPNQDLSSAFLLPPHLGPLSTNNPPQPSPRTPPLLPLRAADGKPRGVEAGLLGLSPSSFTNTSFGRPPVCIAGHRGGFCLTAIETTPWS